MRRMGLTGGLIAGMCLVAVSSSPAVAAYGFCMEPRAPSVYITKPMKPYCAASRSCEQWQVDSYKNEIDRYFDNLKTYLADVDRYRKKAYEYASCMAELD